MLSVTRRCGYSRGDVHRILDGWLVKEYRALRDLMLHELPSPLLVIHSHKVNSQVRVVVHQPQAHHIGFFSIGSRLNDNGVGYKLVERS